MNKLNMLSIVIFVANLIILVLALWRIAPLSLVYILGTSGILIGILSLGQAREKRSLGIIFNSGLLLIVVMWIYLPPYLFSN